jgi:hypothetical protein
MRREMRRLWGVGVIQMDEQAAYRYDDDEDETRQ